MLKGHTYSSKVFLLGMLVFGSLCLEFTAPSASASSSISMSVDTNALNVNVLPNSPNGNFASSNSMTIDVALTGPGGYTLGVSGTSTDLVHTTDNTKVFSSISSAISSSDFSADTSTAATNFNGKWGYLPSKYNSLVNTSYLPAPDSTGDILDVTHGVNDEGEYTISFGARADASMISGTYTNTFVITAVSNYSCSVGNVCYYDNGADGGTMDNQAIGVGDTEVELVGSNYSKLGYGFAGWSPTMLDPDDANFASDFAAATVYGPMETVEVPANRTLELYAVWVPSSGNLQGWTGCSSMNIGDVIALTDTRDGNGYAVSKLADGNCWIIENLRLDFSDEDVELTNMNTNHATAQFMDDANKHPEEIEGSYGTDEFSTDIKYTIGTDENYVLGNYYNYHTFSGGDKWIGYLFNDEQPNAKGDVCPAGWRMPDYKQDNEADYRTLVNATVEGAESLGTFTPSTTPTSGSVFHAMMSFPNNFVADSRDSRTRLFYTYNNYTRLGNYSYYPSGMFGSESQFWVNSYWTVDVNTMGFVVRCIAANSEVHTLSFDANGGTNAPVAETSSNGIFEDIATSEPTRSGYTFVGWMDESGIEVQPGDDYNAGVENTNATLYAIWKNNSCNDSATTIGTGNGTDAVCMQDMNGSVKSFMVSANSAAGSIQTYSLIDARDGQSYSIALLEDGNIWMTKNLNLGRNSNTMLSYVDTNLPSNQSFLLDAANTSTRYYNGETNDGYYNGVYYGGYYGWVTTVASYTYTMTHTNRSTSICPLNWTLPTPAHYAKLISDASITNYATASVAPYNFNNGGYAEISYSNSNRVLDFRNQGTIGFYWTAAGKGNLDMSTASQANAYALSSSDFSVSIPLARYSMSVRCVASNGMATINYGGNGSSTYPVTGSVPSQTVDINTGNIAPNGFTRNGYKFLTWNTRADGTGTDVAVNSSVYSLNLTSGDEITLYAKWAPQVVITYNDNYSGATKVTQLSAGSSTTFGGYNHFARTGYSIKEWNTEPDGSGTVYPVSSSYTTPSDMTEPIFITLYAQWIEDYVITFVDTASGETQTKGINWGKSGTVAPPTTWTYSGYKLLGWDTVTNSGLGGGGTVVYTNGQLVTPSNNMTVYTVWSPFVTLQYDGNGATGTTGMSITQDVAENEEVTLYASNFSRSGYGFAGWSFDPDAANNLANATIYGPNETIIIPSVTTPGETRTLYAVWVQAESGVTMQTFDSTAQPYASATEGTVIALTDSRDNDTYAVAKLADGKWWMIENYRLGGTSAITLNNTNSAIASSSFSLPASSSSFSTNTYTVVQINTANESSAISSMIDINSNIYSYGNYYSWNAAIGSSTSYNSTTVSTSICPYGWHLPTGGASGDFANLSLELDGLTSAMDSNTTPTGATVSKSFRDFPNNFMYSGYKSSRSNFGSRGSYGYYHSSTSYSSSYGKYLTLSSSSISPDTYNPNFSKYYGMSIRCIAGT